MKNKQEKIIFLDIDGVMHPYGADYCSNKWSEEAVFLIQYFCKKYNYKLVLSSDWRMKSKKWWKGYVIKKYLCKYKLKKYFHKCWKIDESEKERAELIVKWIKKYNPKKYIIIDDMQAFDEYKELQKYHVKPNSFFGLKYSHLFDILKIENEKGVSNVLL